MKHVEKHVFSWIMIHKLKLWHSGNNCCCKDDIVSVFLLHIFLDELFYWSHITICIPKTSKKPLEIKLIWNKITCEIPKSFKTLNVWNQHKKTLLVFTALVTSSPKQRLKTDYMAQKLVMFSFPCISHGNKHATCHVCCLPVADKSR